MTGTPLARSGSFGWKTAMLKRLAFSFAAFSLATACGDQAAQPLEPTSYPALWEIAREDGAVEGWLFGTVHALPDDFAWRSPRLEQAIEDADTLVVEVGDLDDGAKLSALFEDMAFDQPEGPISARIREDLRDEFDELLVKAKVRRSYFDPMESWAAALALAQVAQEGQPENGADRALIEAFEGRDLIELEGARSQLAIFDSLPRAEQRDLLNAVLEEAATHGRDSGRLARLWRDGDTDGLEQLTRRGMLADPELRQALLIDRNTAWATRIENLLSARDRPLIAVGAGHLLGEDGLPALLQANGYVVTRVE